MQELTERPEDLITELPAVERVDGVELFDVDDNGVHGSFGMLMKDPVCVLEEVIPVVQSGQLIHLGCPDQLPGLSLRTHALYHQDENHNDIH